ncbi:MAG TPA: hypothetical protein VGL02_32215 [Streptomyces sp.]
MAVDLNEFFFIDEEGVIELRRRTADGDRDGEPVCCVSTRGTSLADLVREARRHIPAGVSQEGGTA